MRKCCTKKLGIQPEIFKVQAVIFLGNTSDNAMKRQPVCLVFLWFYEGKQHSTKYQ